ncbi:MAG: hypothetical protein ACRETL_06160, partial [Gammaproteobacteria bacterium]
GQQVVCLCRLTLGVRTHRRYKARRNLKPFSRLARIRTATLAQTCRFARVYRSERRKPKRAPEG